MSTPTNNPSAIRSRQWLTEALLSLMKEKSYDRITITEIAERADLDRSTFYRHFHSKEAILEQYLDQLAQEYLQRLAVGENMDMGKVAKIFISFWIHIDFIRTARKNDLDSLLLKTFNKHLPSIHQLTKDKFAYSISEENMEFALAFNAGGMWNILMKWIDSDFEHSYDDLVKAFEEISRFNFFR
ncbi:TetR/AcrR family transcriptional regulator [Gracilibacillus alcaliphilus]|uniref:TetR/AcrR family transcriptional regulator n=1 Tax=Gracilibacillus alcaliphilus TaxID=1401441 RepID=UPI00195DF329|nr:TetR/AcrR family transcriptional regulator [Gracilibacillus alcaliphilus]MBM7678812.1 AcrR family transcriptional regulator [Gracilibacillus alcaliphilus]